jgi:CelD/BcsL family acetyltransferase involved in cellulose biosynthesis
VALGLSDLPTDDPATRALFDLCEGERRELAIDRRWGRARLDAGAGAEHPGQCAKQRSRIRGLERKLAAEVGEPEFAIARTPERVEAALEAFLALEQSGWKGQAGSALACAAGTRNFFVDVARAAAGKGRLEVATLSAGGRVLAMATQLLSESRVYGFKAAYDEEHARYAPGLLLLDRLTRHYVDERAGEIDSCATPEQQPVSRLWPARREFVDCRVALGGAVRARLFAAMLACERAARRLSPRR